MKTEQRRVITGLSNSAATSVIGVGFRLVKTGTGLYTIYYLPKFKVAPNVMAISNGPACYATVQSSTMAYTILNLIQATTGSSSDYPFSFVITDCI